MQFPFLFKIAKQIHQKHVYTFLPSNAWPQISFLKETRIKKKYIFALLPLLLRCRFLSTREPYQSATRLTWLTCAIYLLQHGAKTFLKLNLEIPEKYRFFSHASWLICFASAFVVLHILVYKRASSISHLADLACDIYLLQLVAKIFLKQNLEIPEK